LLNAVSIAVVSILPGIMWVWFFASRDRRREPLGMLARAFVAGMLAVIPAALLERPLRPLLVGEGASLVGLLAIGLIEEGVKFLAAFAVAFYSWHFDEPEDGIVYAVTAALGFAVVENAVYTIAFGSQVVFVRAVITSLAHASFAGIFGVYLGLYRMGAANSFAVLRSFLLAAVLHALYDFLVTVRTLSLLPALLLVYAVYRYVLRQMKELTSV
jgi:RsiW-degrading membrane proteinase PrsW (M82 family)